MDTKDLTTKELFIVTAAQSGLTATAIALKLGLYPSDVRKFLKSPEAVAYRLEQEEATDVMIETLYKDGATALKRALHSDNHATALRAAELTFKVLKKLQPVDDRDKGGTVHIDKLLAIIAAPISQKELDGVSKYYDALPQGETVDAICEG